MGNLIIKAAAMFCVPIKAIQSERRHAEIVEARNAIAWAAAQQGYRLCVVARALNRDHSTIGYAVRHASRRAQTDVWYAERLAALL